MGYDHPSRAAKHTQTRAAPPTPGGSAIIIASRAAGLLNIRAACYAMACLRPSLLAPPGPIKGCRAAFGRLARRRRVELCGAIAWHPVLLPPGCSARASRTTWPD
jgi:hypothetical protein